MANIKKKSGINARPAGASPPCYWVIAVGWWLILQQLQIQLKGTFLPIQFIVKAFL